MFSKIIFSHPFQNQHWVNTNQFGIKKIQFFLFVLFEDFEELLYKKFIVIKLDIGI